MNNFPLNNEIITFSLNLISDLISCKESIESMKILYRALIKENSILLCLTTDDDNQKIGIPRIVAMNVTAPETKNNPELTVIVKSV